MQEAESGAVGDAEFAQDFIDLFVELIVMRIGDVADVQDQSGFLHLFERGAKGGEQALWKIADEAHSIGNQQAAIRRRTNGANGGTGRSEHPHRNATFRAHAASEYLQL